MESRRIIIGVSGASGLAYAYDLLHTLQPMLDIEVHLVVTKGAKLVLASEAVGKLSDLEHYADIVHNNANLGASIASGSFLNDGMVIAPCSAGSLAKIALGLTDNLLTRAAHVQLKEKRRLILMLREAPYSRPMLENMLKAHDAGASILPASPHFYKNPNTIDDLIGTITARALDLLGIAHQRSPRWQDGL